ncbi:hypothetical protein P3X46_024686 [Hevea brasiliensis]|uniref:Disease resistance protein RPM1-like n=1 Tax=Hevea brasiliensis TaxID=3981 RepID=A0ABQ9L4C8_HEVBR|nr:hypothetical protein P3X46_024686 [Hevea brasiliensis]
MLEGSVTFLLMKLSEILTDQNDLLFGVRGDAKYIRDELQFSLAVLRDAESMEEEEIDPLLKVWVKNLRDVAYEMEDVLDDFKLHLAHDHGHGFSRHQIASTMRDIRTRIREIKIRVEDISKARSSFTHINSRWREVNYSGGADLAAQQDAFPLEEANLVGIEMPKGRLIGWLLGSKSELEVVSVVGMAGVGKTTLVKLVYENSEVKKHFMFCAWIVLTQYFKTGNLLKDIVQQLYYVLREPSPEGIDTMSDHELRVEINKFLQQRRYLIVLDDVWNNDAWNTFKHAFPNNKEGSRILLTTRRSEVAKNASIESPDKIYALNPLSSEEAWTLFCRKTFRSNSCPPHLENVSQQILGRCEGLPLAITAISGVLATRDNTRIDEWDMIYRSLSAEIQANNSLGSMKKVLSLSYYNLPYYLKCCLLYFSIFPEGYPIERRRLIRLWIAEGFVVETEGRMLEEVAEGYLNELIERSLVQVVEATSDGRVKKCRIQGLLHDIITSMAKDQGFAAIAKEESMMLPERVRRLSIQNARARIQRISQFTSASGLRSLLVFSGLDILPESPLFDLSPSNLRMLNVLELGGTHLEDFPNEVTNLLLLKYLSLRNTEVNYIPSSIGNLQYLETLDLKNSRVIELPNTILKLQKLHHILVYRYDTKFADQMETKQTIGFKLPTHIRGLQSLQKLCFLEANQDLMRELGKLTKLRRLGIVNLRREDGSNLCPSIEKLTNLRALSVVSTTEKRLPDWISSLDNLEKVVLKWSWQSGDPLLSLQHLPSLVHVEFVQVYDGELLHFRAKGFRSLKFLGLNKLDRLREIIIEPGAVPFLQKLVVQNCGLLQRVPSGIEHLTHLRVLEFINMAVNLIVTLHPDRNDGDYLKIAEVPEVYFYTYWNNGKWDVFSLEIFRKGGPQSKQSSQLSTSSVPVEVSSTQEITSTLPIAHEITSTLPIATNLAASSPNPLFHHQLGWRPLTKVTYCHIKLFLD